MANYSRDKKMKRPTVAATGRPKLPGSGKVTNAVSDRTGARLAALGGTVKGVDGTDGYTRKEARLVKRARRYQKAGRTRARTLKTWEGSTYNPKNNPDSPFAGTDTAEPTVARAANIYVGEPSGSRSDVRRRRQNRRARRYARRVHNRNAEPPTR